MASSAHGQGLRHNVGCWVAFLRTNYIILLIVTTLVYFPRLMLSYAVFIFAQLLRLVARVVGVAGRGDVSNRRILVVTDYLPPQTHGIAIRCHAYVKEMRAKGHEVIVFSTAGDPSMQTSFDHPNIPSVVNPFNLKNRIGYNPGVKLAWYLGAHSWDVVHVFCPSLVSVFVCSVCCWRRIPIYSSHHVEVEMFAEKMVPIRAIYAFGMCFYNLLCKWPSTYWGTLNAAPTLTFAKGHCGVEYESRLRCVPSGTHECFTAVPSSETERQDVRRARFNVKDDKTRVILMVQRLSAEKGTERIFPALLPAGGEDGETVEPGTVLALAGDGPVRRQLEAEARAMQLPVIFLGNVPHHELPQLYRAADCFVTMSMTETFGLTCLEAIMCGCPAVMPYCDVFDEIWNDKVPRSWRYEINSLPQLVSAIATAQAPSGREYLAQNPVRKTWKGATEELLEHYEECIKIGERKRKSLKNAVLYVDHSWRLLIFGIVSHYILSRYYFGVKYLGNMVQDIEWTF